MKARIHTLPLLAITFGIASLVGFEAGATNANGSVERDAALDNADTPRSTSGPRKSPIKRVTLDFKAAPPSSPPAPPPKTYTWVQTQEPVLMGRVDDYFCFLTEVTGRFEGAGEHVHVSQSDDHWWLGGNSKQSDLKASALCIPRKWRKQRLDVSDEYTWSQNNNPTDMGSDANRVCFLTRVTGKFEGGGERVKAYQEKGRWWLGGNSLQTGVAARARCVNSVHRLGPTKWTQGEGSKPLADSSQWACGLTLMQGRFLGGGERVVVEDREGQWHLGGHSQQRDVGAEAYCM